MCVSRPVLLHHRDHPPSVVVLAERLADWLTGCLSTGAYVPSRLWPPASPVASTDWSFPRNISGRQAGNQEGGCGGAEKRGSFYRGLFLTLLLKSFFFFRPLADTCVWNVWKPLENNDKVPSVLSWHTKCYFFPLFWLLISYIRSLWRTVFTNGTLNTRN